MCTRLYFPIGIHPSPLLQSRQELPAKSRRSIVHAISRSMSSSTFVSHSSRNFEKNLQVESRRGSNRSRVRGRSAKTRGKGWLFHGSPGATGCPFPFRFPGIRNYFEFACFRRGILRGRRVTMTCSKARGWIQDDFYDRFFFSFDSVLLIWRCRRRFCARI